MKKISVIVAAFAIVSLSSCYVEVRDQHRYHHPFWHHRNTVEIRGENNSVKQPQANHIHISPFTYAVKE